jgi:hypothetical protein
VDSRLAPCCLRVRPRLQNASRIKKVQHPTFLRSMNPYHILRTFTSLYGGLQENIGSRISSRGERQGEYIRGHLHRF